MPTPERVISAPISYLSRAISFSTSRALSLVPLRTTDSRALSSAEGYCTPDAPTVRRPALRPISQPVPVHLTRITRANVTERWQLLGAAHCAQRLLLLRPGCCHARANLRVVLCRDAVPLPGRHHGILAREEQANSARASCLVVPRHAHRHCARGNALLTAAAARATVLVSRALATARRRTTDRAARPRTAPALMLDHGASLVRSRCAAISSAHKEAWRYVLHGRRRGALGGWAGILLSVSGTQDVRRRGHVERSARHSGVARVFSRTGRSAAPHG